VRRGDYLKLSHIYGELTPQYYFDAYQKILLNTGPLERISFFSDDIDWVKNNIKLPVESTYITTDMGLTTVEEFELMRAHRHFIIPNSTFSWWAAYLKSSVSPETIVTYPTPLASEEYLKQVKGIFNNWYECSRS
jgi:hypothetical protein